MTLVLDDNGKHLDFAPLTLTRPVGNLRMGILTNDERWKLLLPQVAIAYRTEPYLSGKFPEGEGIEINACVIPTKTLAEAVVNLRVGQELRHGSVWLARIGELEEVVDFHGDAPVILNHRWDLFRFNGEVLTADFKLLTDGRVSTQLSASNTVIGDPNAVFVEEGARVEVAILNTTNGPIYVGKDAEIMEGSLVRGPFALCEHGGLKMGTKVYGPTTIGPHCKVGGEVNNVVFQAYSNKGHDGFLGNSVIGEWCNLGAGTNASNLKNNYGAVKTYDFKIKSLVQTDLQFMGLVMGDHSKCGINTMFNTATVVGVSANVFGAEFPPKYIPSFAWGGSGERYAFEKVVESANNMMTRRGLTLSTDEIAILKHIADTY